MQVQVCTRLPVNPSRNPDRYIDIMLEHKDCTPLHCRFAQNEARVDSLDAPFIISRHPISARALFSLSCSDALELRAVRMYLSTVHRHCSFPLPTRSIFLCFHRRISSRLVPICIESMHRSALATRVTNYLRRSPNSSLVRRICVI